MGAPRGAWHASSMSRFQLSQARPFGEGNAEAALTIRPARRTDTGALLSLAALDSARPLTGDGLVAEVDGRIVAAVSLRDGRSIADPFTPTAGAVEMLRMRTALPARRRRRPAFGGFGGWLRPGLA
jgi:hypothetical protein